MKRRMVHFFAALLSMIGLTLAGSAFAGAPTDVLKVKQTTALDLLKQSGPAAQKKIDALFDELLDYQALAEGSLGTEWGNRTDAEKAQFMDLLKQLVRKSYQKNLKKISDFNVDYQGENAVDGGVMVNTTSKPTSARDEPVEINFKMAAANGTWKVQDIITEGASLVSSYRSQFTKIIEKDGFARVIEKMKDKLAKGDNG